MVYGLSDSSYKLDDRSVGGDLVILGNKSNFSAVPLYWKLKMIRTVCHLAKVAETRSMIRLTDDAQFFTLQLQQLLFDDCSQRIPIKLFMDSKPLLETVGSVHQIDEKLLRNSISNMKDLLYDGIVESYSWLNGSTDMIADILTKECCWNDDLEDLVTKNVFRLARNVDNLVSCNLGEIKISNKCNKKT
jgi:hypothetical protein